MRRLGSGFVFFATAVGLLVGCGDVDDEVEERVGSAEQAQLVCAEDDTVEGIDVSYYQGSINWPAVAGDVDFAISRVNHGGFFDPEFDTNWAASRDAGLIRGAYQYFDPGGDPVAQATTLIDAIGELAPGDLPPVIDVESTDGLGANAIANNVGIWLDMVESALGRAPIIYTGSYFWNDNVGTDAFTDHPLWIAHYTTGCPNLPTVWSRWGFWQYTSTGSVAGIGGNVDRDRFNGNLLELHDMAADGYRAAVVSLDYPTVLHPGESGTVRLKLENLGARSWGAETRLGTTEPRDRDSDFFAASWESASRVMAMPMDVASGETVELVFDIVAPGELGLHSETFNLVEEGVAWFSDIAPGGGPLDDAILLAITVEEGPGGEGGGGSTGNGGGGEGGSGESIWPDRDKLHGDLHGQVGCSISSGAPRDAGSATWLLLALVGFAGARRRLS
ncbi:MAG: GH25 family lysozyme [Polyangiaceae bacterium]